MRVTLANLSTRSHQPAPACVTVGSDGGGIRTAFGVLIRSFAPPTDWQPKTRISNHLRGRLGKFARFRRSRNARKPMIRSKRLPGSWRFSGFCTTDRYSAEPSDPSICLEGSRISRFDPACQSSRAAKLLNCGSNLRCGGAISMN